MGGQSVGGTGGMAVGGGGGFPEVPEPPVPPPAAALSPGAPPTVPTWPGQPPGSVPFGVPPPPLGPGVQPPFAAPPTDGARSRRWVAVGLSIGAAMVLCFAGAGGFGGLVVLALQVVREQAQTAVTEYLTALRDRDFREAYDMLCDPLQASTSRVDFEREQRGGPRVTGFEVRGADLSEAIEVPTRIEYDDGSIRSVRFLMYQDPDTGEVEVCGEAD